MKPFEIIEHTAEIGIKGYGRTVEELFEHMAEGMFSLIVPPEEVRLKESASVEAKGEGKELLLAAWLRELLYLFDTRKIVGRSFKIERLKETQLLGTVSGEKLDLARHRVDKEIKAVTYCDLGIRQEADGTWSAQVIFDI